MDPNSDKFHTADLCLITLLSSRYTVSGVRVVGMRRVEYIFDATDDLTSYVEDIKLGHVQVEPIEFCEKLSKMKAEIYRHLKFNNMNGKPSV